MIEIGIARPREAAYQESLRFACEAYRNRHGIRIDGAADVFAFARHDESLLGCFGLYRGALRSPLLLETFFPDAFSACGAGRAPHRSECGELGTRAVCVPPGFSARSVEVSLALSARIISFAYGNGVRWLGFTTNRSIYRLAQALDFDLTFLGRADLSCKDESFRENWAPFFQVPQYGFLLRVSSSTRCAEVLSLLLEKWKGAPAKAA